MNRPDKPDLSAMMACPRFRRCNVPICPLDPWQEKRVYVRGERKCGMPKAERIELAKLVSKEQLPMRGMVKKEWAATLRERRKGTTTKRKKIALTAFPVPEAQ